MKSLVDLDDFSLEEVRMIVEKAAEIKKCPEKFSNSMNGKILANLFFEPSTRTQFSFQTAMYKLGGHTIGFSNSSNSSVSKGENFKDTIRVVSGYADVLVIRHFLQGAAFAAGLYSNCPIINAGDGGHLHPTQTLTDVFTILEHRGSLNNLSIGICGDLKFGRTVNSLIKLLMKFKNVKFFLISSENFKLSNFLKEKIIKAGNEFFEVDCLKDVIFKLDVLYMTRIQKERFQKTEKMKEDLICLDKETLNFAKENLIILHPLPRTQEVSIEVDKDARALYFEQAVNGVFVRMALILSIFSFEEKGKKKFETFSKFCHNENCITRVEKYVPKFFRRDEEKILCEFCENQIE